MSIHPNFLGPDGKIKPLADYAPELAAKPWGRPAVTLSPETYPQGFNADGSPKSTAQMRKEAAESQFAKDLIDAKVRAKTQKLETDDTRLLRALDAQIEQAGRDARYSTGPADRARNLQYADHLKARKAEVEARIADEKRIAALANHRQVQLARDYAQTYQRSPPPGVTPEQIALIVAMANRTDCDPQTLQTEFWREVATTEAQALQIATRQASEKRELALRAEWEASLSDVDVAASRQRLHQAQQGGPDGIE